MKFFKYIFILFFFTVFVGIVAGVLFSWTNIWVPKNSVALFSVLSNSGLRFTKKPDKTTNTALNNTRFAKQIVITRKGFNWHWQRMMPGWTELTIFSKTAQSYTLNTSFALPKAIIYAATNTRTNTSDFIVDIASSFTYSLDQQQIADYVNTHKTTTTYGTQNFILDSLKKEVSFLLEKELSQIANTLSTKVSFSSGIKNTITTELQKYSKNISQEVTQLVPITIHNFDIKITNDPNFALYIIIQKLLEVPKSSPELSASALIQTDNDVPPSFTADAFSKSTQRLEYYLYFIQELSKIAGKEPQLTELMKMFPPKEILSIE